MSHSLLFNKSDFENPVTFEMLRAIATVGAGNHIMQPYASLTAKQQRLTNEYLNNYIKTSLSSADCLSCKAKQYRTSFNRRRHNGDGICVNQLALIFFIL